MRKERLFYDNLLTFIPVQKIVIFYWVVYARSLIVLLQYKYKAMVCHLLVYVLLRDSDTIVPRYGKL